MRIYIPHKDRILQAVAQIDKNQAAGLLKLINSQDDTINNGVVIETYNDFDEMRFNIFVQDTYCWNRISDFGGGIVRDVPYGLCTILTEDDIIFLVGILTEKAGV